MLQRLLLKNEKAVSRAKFYIGQNLDKKICNMKELLRRKPQSKNLKSRLERTKAVRRAVLRVPCLHLLKNSLKQDVNLLTENTNGKGSPENVAETMLLENILVIGATKNIKDELNLDDNVNPGWKDDLDVIVNEIYIKRKSLKEQQQTDVNEIGGGEGFEGHNEKLMKAQEDRKPQNLAVDSFLVSKSGDNYLSTVKINVKKMKETNVKEVKKTVVKEVGGGEWLEEESEKIPSKYTPTIQKGQGYQYTKKFWQVPNWTFKSPNYTPPTGSISRKGMRPQTFINNRPYIYTPPTGSIIRKGIRPQTFINNRPNIYLPPTGNIIRKGMRPQTFLNNRPKIYTQNLKIDNRSKYNPRLLHPSWVAKKNMRQPLPKFEGKKIIFNDNE